MTQSGKAKFNVGQFWGGENGSGSDSGHGVDALVIKYLRTDDDCVGNVLLQVCHCIH